MSETRRYRNVSTALLSDVAEAPVQPGAEFEAKADNPALGTYLRVGYAIPLDSLADAPTPKKPKKKEI